MIKKKINQCFFFSILPKYFQFFISLLIIIVVKKLIWLIPLLNQIHRQDEEKNGIIETSIACNLRNKVHQTLENLLSLPTIQLKSKF